MILPAPDVSKAEGEGLSMIPPAPVVSWMEEEWQPTILPSVEISRVKEQGLPMIPLTEVSSPAPHFHLSSRLEWTSGFQLLFLSKIPISFLFCFLHLCLI